MRLQDWDIDVSFARMSALNTDGLAFGSCSCIPSQKKAEILVAEPEEWANIPKKFSAEELHRVLVHELTHIIFWPVSSDPDSEILETAVNQIERIISSFIVE